MPTTDETKARLFAFIGETTKRAQAAGVVERMKALRSVKESTARTYERNAQNRLDLSSPGGGRLLEGVSGRSFHAIRAALLHEAARLYGEARKAADEAGRAGDLAGQVAAAKKARVAVEAVETIQAARKPENAAPKRTKRATVPKAEGGRPRRSRRLHRRNARPLRCCGPWGVARQSWSSALTYDAAKMGRLWSRCPARKCRRSAGSPAACSPLTAAAPRVRPWRRCWVMRTS